MKYLDKFYREKHEDYLDEINQVLDTHSSFYKSIRIRSVASFRNQLWENESCMVQAFSKEELPKIEKSRFYKNYALLEEWITVEKLKEILQCLSDKKIKIDNIDIILNEYAKFSYISYFAGSNAYSKHPGLLIQSNQSSPRGDGLPIINWNFTAYPTPHDAIADWIYIKEFRESQKVSTINQFLVFLPECRAWIKDVKVYGKKTIRFLLNVSNKYPPLKLKGHWDVDKTFLPIDLLIKRNVFYLKIPQGEINSLNFYLIDEAENIYDFHDLSHQGSKERNEILLQINTRPSLKKLVLGARLLGESGKLELKPYIEPKHSKTDELIETVIAFANAEGGTVLIGVNKKGEIDGIENEVSPNPKKFKKELISYIGQLRSLISEGIGKELEIKTTPVKIGRNTVLAVEIPRGFQKPYSFARNGKCYIRRGASNMLASPEEIQKMGELNSILNIDNSE